MKKRLLFFFMVAVHHLNAQTIIQDAYSTGAFAVATPTSVASILVDAKEDSLVQIAARLLAKDIEMVSDKKPSVTTSISSCKNIIVIGSYQSPIIQQLVNEKKLALSAFQKTWEGYQVQVVSLPFAGVQQALVVVGSDRRGTAYGVMELSRQIGVSPWVWWADVPVKKKKEIYVKKSASLSDAPKVAYRGIFINDEAPSLSTWSKATFGGFNHLFYEKVFELMLRLKANYMWPAMWGSAFYDDDSLNRQTADKWGIIIGTSHHEPLMRAHDEWRRYGRGKWNYDSNEVQLKEFWRSGMQRATNEKIVSIGMRGDGDEPMSRETATTLLERIVSDQRKIIEEVTGKPARETPQLWALYKEVQDYYDKGMRVPDDVTLLLCDDNWGNLRKLPKLNEPKRKGGYGIYYHFDYVGGPRNYKWINTNNLARVWEQMHLAWEYGAQKIWIVNVGDIKPMELPTSFFLEYAWNPGKWNEDNIATYYTQWAEAQFGAAYAQEIGDLLLKYSQYSARRKPELLDDKTYSLTAYNEAERVVLQWKALAGRAERMAEVLPAMYRDAFYQLVGHPVQAYANLQQLYLAVAKNKFYAALNDAQANKLAEQAKQFYKNDSLITEAYHSIAHNKWKGMMSQTHIGYTYWQQPPVNKMPDLKYIPQNATKNAASFSSPDPMAAIVPKEEKGNVFQEVDGVVSIEAAHWTKAVNAQNMQWKVIPDIGRTGSGITTFPVTASAVLSNASPHVAYDFYTYNNGAVKVNLIFSPTLNFSNTEEGLQFAVSIDKETPQIISLNAEEKNTSSGVWNKWVSENCITKISEHKLLSPGKHTLKYWAISPAVVLQKMVVDLQGLKPSYLGPEETRDIGVRNP